MTTTVSALTIKQVSLANKQTGQAQINVSEACRRAVRVIYSKNDASEANYIITNLNKVLRAKAVSFFKSCGVVIIENRGELPRADRALDKSKQAKVFETLNAKLVGDTTVETAEQVAEKAEKAATKAQAKKDATPVKERVLDTLRKSFAQAQKSNDYDVQTALQLIINQYEAGKIIGKALKAVDNSSPYDLKKAA